MTLTAALTVLLFAATPVLADAERELQALATKAKAGEEVDFTRLRFAWAASSAYDPYYDTEAAYQETLAGIVAAIDGPKPERGTKLCRESLDAYFLDLKWNMRCKMAFDAAELADGAALHDFLIRGILDSIHASGDGHAPETAFRVVSVTEEYDWLAVLGLERSEQSLIEVNGHPYDRLEVTHVESGEEYVVWFDVSPIMASLERKFER